MQRAKADARLETVAWDRKIPMDDFATTGCWILRKFHRRDSQEAVDSQVRPLLLLLLTVSVIVGVVVVVVDNMLSLLLVLLLM